MKSVSEGTKVFSCPLLNVAGVVIGALLCGCGSGGTFLPGAAAKPVPGIPAGPTMGYIWSSNDQTLRPIQGVSGSSLVGQSIVPSGTYVTGAASAESGLGLVEDASGNLFLLDLPSATPALIATGVSSQAHIVFSPSGGEAVAFGVGGTNVILLSNLASKPQAASIALTSGTKLSGAAVSDAGTVLVSNQANPVVVGTVSATGVLSRLTTISQAGGLSFLPGSDDALVADGGGSAVSLLHSVSGSFSVQALGSTGVNKPLAVASSQDARWAVVANGGDQNVLWIDLKNGGVPSKLTCSCQATQLSLLAGGKTFRLNEPGSGPVWMADLTGATPQLLFVPAFH